MTDYAADDFAFIRAKMQQLQCEQVAPTQDTSSHWWCPKCCDGIDGVHVSYEETHTVCGTKVQEYCDECDSGGWVRVYSPRLPAFGECPKCYNPNNYRSP
jgi:hypothetical protein